MDSKDARELQRLADYTEKLDDGLSELREETKKQNRTLYGDPNAIPEPIPGLVQRLEHVVSNWKRMVRIGCVLFTILSALGAFFADIGKDLIKQWLGKKIDQSNSEDFREHTGKQKIVRKHFLITPNPRPMRKLISETKDKIIIDIYVDQKPEDTGEEFLR